jgi:alkylated DNA repair protein (DNA oxidative demethylase)
MTLPDLFDEPRLSLGEGAVLLRGFALYRDQALVRALTDIVHAAPLRNMVTPGGFTMSVAMTNCGQAGWVTDRTGYRYDPCDPESGGRWPAMPDVFADLAKRAAAEAGFPDFRPESCLINRYEPRAQLSLHQDRNERDLTQPIVSVSLGLPATFLFGGLKRSDRPSRIAIRHGDIAVWGGPARLRFHGVAPLADGYHPLLGRCRINLTLRNYS